MRWRTDSLLLAATTVLLASSGCSTPNKSGPNHLGKLPQPRQVALVYRTNSDRLNVALSGATNAVQQAAFHPNSASILPPVTISTLRIRYPHPAGRTDLAQVYLKVSPSGGDSATDSSSMIAQLAGLGEDTGNEIKKPIGAWTMDIPKWQVEGVVAKLQKANFFRRSKILTASSYLGVNLDGRAFGKNYRNVDELDALIVRVRQFGRPAGPDGNPLVPRRPSPAGYRPPRAPTHVAPTHVAPTHVAPTHVAPPQYPRHHRQPNWNAPHQVPGQPRPAYQHPQAWQPAGPSTAPRPWNPPANQAGYQAGRSGQPGPQGAAGPGYEPRSPQPWGSR